MKWTLNHCRRVWLEFGEDTTSSEAGPRSARPTGDKNGGVDDVCEYRITTRFSAR